MADQMSELANIVLEKVWELCYQHRGLADAAAERDRLVAEVKTLRAKLERSQQQASDFVQTIDDNDKRLRDAEERVWPGQTHGCDAPEWMADEIEVLRVQLAEAERDRDHWRESRQQAIEAGELMKAEIEGLKIQLVAVGQDRDRFLANLRGLEALVRDAEERVWPGETRGCDAPRWMAFEIQMLRAEVERLKEKLAAAGDGAELERLRKFARRVREACRRRGLDVLTRVQQAIADLDAAEALAAVRAEEPAPVTKSTEQNGGAE